MKLYCPDCGSMIPAVDMNFATSTAKCPACNMRFSFNADSANIADPGFVSGDTSPPIVVRPANMVVEEFAGTWRVSWRWFTPAAVFMVLFCVVWDGFLVFWYSIAFRTDAPWIMTVFPILHVAVGIALTYCTIATFINSTRVEVSGQALTVWHGPMPWLGNRTIAASEIQQLYCERSYSRDSNHNNGWVRFSLSAVLRGGTKAKLLTGFTDPERALFLERELERRLNISAVPVLGEYRP